MEPTHDVRPRLRADALFTATDGGVLFQYPEGQFVLKGRTAYPWMCRLAPHLTGAHTVAELCDGLPKEREDAVIGIVRTLLERGAVRDVRPDGSGAREGSSPLPEAVLARFRDQLAYLDHQLGGPAATSFARFRDTRVLIVGGGEAAESCAVTLLRNGLRAVTLTGAYEEAPHQLLLEQQDLRAAGCDADVVMRAVGEKGPDDADNDVDLVVACGTGHGELLRRNRAALDGGPALLPLTSLDGAAVLGPLVLGPLMRGAGHGEGAAEGLPGGCWQCAVLRLAANLEPTAAAALLRAVHTGRPSDRPDAQLGRMLGTTLAFDVFRHRTGALPAESAGALVIQDRTTWETSRETLLAHPDCGACGEPPRAPAGRGERTVPRAPAGSRPAEEGVLFGSHAGVFRRYADDELPQSPLRAATVEVAAPGPSAVSPRAVTAFALDTQTDARAAARNSAALVYEALLHAHGMPRSASPYVPDTAHERVSGVELSNWSGTAEPAGPDGRPGQAPWLRAWVWDPTEQILPAHGRTVAVPAAAVHPGGALNRDRRFEPGSAGAGAGATVDAAARAGLLSALAYEGVVAALRGKAAARELSVDTPADGDCAFLLRSLAHLDQRVTLLELPGAAPAHAVAALASHQASDRTAEALGHGSTRTEAAVHALRDLLGVLQLGCHDRTVDLGDPLVPGLDAGALRATAVESVPPAVLSGTEEMGPGPRGHERLGTMPDREVLVVVTTPPDLRAGGLETVRVLLRKPREAPA